MKDEKQTGSLNASKKGDAAQVVDSVSPQKTAQGERHPDMQHVDGALEAAVPAVLLHAVMHPACDQPPPAEANQQLQSLQAILPMPAETDCAALIWYWLAGAAWINGAAVAAEEAEADVRVDGNSRWGQGS